MGSQIKLRSPHYRYVHKAENILHCVCIQQQHQLTNLQSILFVTKQQSSKEFKVLNIFKVSSFAPGKKEVICMPRRTTWIPSRSNLWSNSFVRGFKVSSNLNKLGHHPRLRSKQARWGKSYMLWWSTMRKWVMDITFKLTASTISSSVLGIPLFSSGMWGT